MCSLISPAAALPRASVPVRGRAADLEGVIPKGCHLLPGDLMDLVRIEPARTTGEPRWDGWTDGSPTNRIRVTLYTEDLDAIRAAGYALPKLLNRETPVNVPFYLGSEQDRFMWRIALVVPAPKPPVIQCRTGDLQAGDVIRQQYKPVNGGMVETLLEVVAYTGKVGSQHQIVLKDLATGAVETRHWSGGDQVIVAGPKIKAYAANPEVCLPARNGNKPVWNGQLAAPV